MTEPRKNLKKMSIENWMKNNVYTLITIYILTMVMVTFLTIINTPQDWKKRIEDQSDYAWMVATKARMTTDITSAKVNALEEKINNLIKINKLKIPDN